MWYLIGIIIYLGISINIIMFAYKWAFGHTGYAEWKGSQFRFKVLAILTAPIVYVVMLISELFGK